MITAIFENGQLVSPERATGAAVEVHQNREGQFEVRRHGSYDLPAYASGAIRHVYTPGQIVSGPWRSQEVATSAARMISAADRLTEDIDRLKAAFVRFTSLKTE